MAAAEKEVAQAETQKLPEARTKLETASKALATAEAALATKSAAKPVYLFIDEVRTPSSMDVYTSDLKDVKDNKDGWTWKTLNIRAPDDAGAAEGKLWRQILSGTPYEGSRDVTLAFGDKEGTLPRTDAVIVEKVKLRVYHLPLLISGALGLALMAAGLIGLGWDTGLLRDTPPPAPTAPAPFSLARVQFAWWLFLVIGGYLYVWLVTGQFIGVVTAGVLALMGISGASGLAAQVIDPTPNTNPSQGFLRDIMSESGTFVLQRVQMAAWTVILGVIFLWTTLDELLVSELRYQPAGDGGHRQRRLPGLQVQAVTDHCLSAQPIILPRKASQASICDRATNSLGWWACEMSPGPQITVGMPWPRKMPASVP